MIIPPYTGNNELDAFLVDLANNGLGSGVSLIIDTNTDPTTGEPVGYQYQFIHIKYADDNKGSGFSNTQTLKNFFGVFNSSSSIESENPSDYTWYEITFGFGNTRSLYYLPLGGRQIKFVVDNAPPNYKFLVDSGAAIDLDIIVPASTITTEEILNGAITELKIANAAITAAKTNIAALDQATGNLNANTVSAAQIMNDAVTELKLLDSAVTNTKIAANTITGSKIAAETIGAGNIAAGAITTVKLEAGAVVADKIAADAVTTNKIAANAITSDKIVANAITANKLNVSTLSAISANMGTINAGLLQSNDGLFVIDLTNKQISISV